LIFPSDTTFLNKPGLSALGPVTYANSVLGVLLALFVPAIQFSSTFVAQYMGANRKKEIGNIFWHAIYLSISLGAFSAALAIPLKNFFRVRSVDRAM